MSKRIIETNDGKVIGVSDFEVSSDADAWLLKLKENSPSSTFEILDDQDLDYRKEVIERKRRLDSDYPSTEEQLEALYFARMGDNSHLDKVDQRIAAIIGKIP